MARLESDEIARVLDEIAERLEAQDANPHRVRAFRNGAQSVRNAPEPVARWVEEGHEEKLVVIYYDRERFEGQGPVVTESGGPLAGKRVVRGREAECRRYCEQRSE
jgi:hypothetical protein